jgi:hypothetical protein
MHVISTWISLNIETHYAKLMLQKILTMNNILGPKTISSKNMFSFHFEKKCLMCERNLKLLFYKSIIALVAWPLLTWLHPFN